ncbi:MAG TPA: hypothetical protein VGJ32_07685 [Solirubrobacteraceae bacterium]|jgi:hypothetical protein
MSAFADALADAGGAAAPRERAGQLRSLLERELERGAGELAKPRSGYGDPIAVAVAAVPGSGLLAVAPVAASLRADPYQVDERGWLLVAALAGALVVAGGRPITAGAFPGGHLVLRSPGDDPELATLAFDEYVADVDRVRARALAVPGAVLEPAAVDLREPIGARHPLKVAEALAALGANPADPGAADANEDAVLAALGPDEHQVTRPHDDPQPARRVARRILQRLAGMGKWGGYHTEFSHLARGFAGNDRALAEDVGEKLLKSGLLLEKPSVGQRHVFLNPRRAAEIYALVDKGAVPRGLDL